MNFRQQLEGALQYFDGIFATFRQNLDEAIIQVNQIFKDILEKENDLQIRENILYNIEKELSLKGEAFSKNRKAAEDMYSLPSEIVEINVGGEVFFSLKSTLTRFPNSFLASMFSGKHPITYDQKGRIFIDRDPKLFRHILSGLRNDMWPIPKQTEESLFLSDDLAHFGLPSSLLNINRTVFKCFDPTVFIIGGFNENHNESNTIISYYQATNSFSVNRNMTSPRVNLAGVFFKGMIYIIGGCTNNVVLKSVEFFDPKTLTWTSVASLQTPRRDLAAVVLYDSIYAIGGEDNNLFHLKTVERFQLSGCAIEDGVRKIGVWEYICPLSYYRFAPAAVVSRDCIFVAGGLDQNDYPLNSVEYYDYQLNTWTPLKPLNYSRDCLAMAASRGFLYVLGGYDNTGPTNRVERYDFTEDKWVEITPMLNQITSFGAICLDDNIYIFGGCDGTNRLNLVDCYDVESDSWFSHTFMPFGCSNASVVLFQDQ